MDLDPQVTLSNKNSFLLCSDTCQGPCHSKLGKYNQMIYAVCGIGYFLQEELPKQWNCDYIM